MAVEGPISTEWLDLFEQYRDLDLEPTDYFSLDKLDAVPALQFLKPLCWAQVRDWIKNDTNPMSLIPHPDLEGGGQLFIGGMNDALNDATLDAHDIRAVVSLHPQDLLAWDPDDAEYGLRRFTEGTTTRRRAHLLIPLSDDAKDNLLDRLPAVHEFLQTHLVRNGENVLVHCKSGRSRSVAVVAAYLQRTYWETRLQQQPAGGVRGAEALEMLERYRTETIAQIQAWRLPVVLIMDRFLPLLRTYDLQLVGDPEYERQRAAAKLSEASKDKVGGGEGAATAVKAVGAVLKLGVAIVFYQHRQKPMRSVVERFFSVRDEYFPDLEGLGKGHAQPGIVKYYVGFANEYGIVVPEAALDVLARVEASQQ